MDLAMNIKMNLIRPLSFCMRANRVWLLFDLWQGYALFCHVIELVCFHIIKYDVGVGNHPC